MRYELHQFVQLRFGKETFIPAEGVNISTRGIGCHVSKPIELYSKMYFMLQLDPEAQDPEIRGEGIIIRCDSKEEGGFDVGMEFTDLPQYMVSKIEQFLTEA